MYIFLDQLNRVRRLDARYKQLIICIYCILLVCRQRADKQFLIQYLICVQLIKYRLSGCIPIATRCISLFLYLIIMIVSSPIIPANHVNYVIRQGKEHQLADKEESQISLTSAVLSKNFHITSFPLVPFAHFFLLLSISEPPCLIEYTSTCVSSLLTF